jgi:hypothetical protein
VEDLPNWVDVHTCSDSLAILSEIMLVKSSSFGSFAVRDPVYFLTLGALLNVVE